MPGREDQGGVGVAERTTAAHDGLTAAAMATDPKGEPDAQLQAQLDADFTARVIASMGPNTPPRLAQIMPSLIRHMHTFAREVNLTVAEWAAGVKVVSRVGLEGGEERRKLSPPPPFSFHIRSIRTLNRQRHIRWRGRRRKEE